MGRARDKVMAAARGALAFGALLAIEGVLVGMIAVAAVAELHDWIKAQKEEFDG